MMSANTLKRSFLEESALPAMSSYPPVTKRCRFSHMDGQTIDRAPQEFDYDLDVEVKRLDELSLEHVEKEVDDSANTTSGSDQMGREEWGELFIREMASATSLDDARVRAIRSLERFEKSITERAGAENVISKDQEQRLIRQNTVLKKAVAIQYERNSSKDKEIHRLKQLVAQYERQKEFDSKEKLNSQEQISNLKVKSYALEMHLKIAQQNSPIPAHINRDLF